MEDNQQNSHSTLLPETNSEDSSVTEKIEHTKKINVTKKELESNVLTSEEEEAILHQLNTTLTRYRVIKPIGHGGMGYVYLASHNLLDRTAVIKVLNITDCDNDYITLFQSEATLMAKITHKLFAKIYDFYQADNLLIIIMEYIPGNSLHTIIEQDERLNISRASRIIVKIAEGIQYLHSNNILHGDIKPANIMIEANDNTKIIDFGLAKNLSPSHVNLSIGTEGYAAPELYDNPETADERSDLYSLGVLFYEILTGRTIQKEKIYFEESDNINRKIEQIIQQATAENINDRFQNVKAFIESIKSATSPQTFQKTVIKEYSLAEPSIKKELQPLEEAKQPFIDLDKEKSNNQKRTKKFLWAAGGLSIINIIIAILYLFGPYFFIIPNKPGIKLISRSQLQTYYQEAVLKQQNNQKQQ